ncbi:MAG: peptidoglycan bridge formation glycyltransferase FemA/FemB family protein [Salinivirgaceae bacterium]|jgi:lipid II:glycine glycyltransferase (peptidoglycan interpeptide bridge formation enzyme)
MFKILDLGKGEDIKEYEKLYCKIGKKDPYFLIDYINVFNNRKKELICFAYETDSSVIILPGYLHEIDIETTEKYYDFVAPYGYTGPHMSENATKHEIEFFWRNVGTWYQNNNVITEFLRFNLYGNEKNYDGNLIPTLLNVKGKIIDAETQWSNFEHKVRKNVKRAQKEGLRSEIFHLEEVSSQEIKNFHDIYIHTMERTNAQKRFFFPFEDFLFFIQNNPESSAVCNIYFQDKIISSELILVSDDSIFSFLGGTDENYFDKRPNDFLKFETINWARDNNKKFYVLGGGHGYEDGIYNYKKSFFPNDIVTYYTGRKIVNNQIYRELVEITNKKRQETGLDLLDIENSNYFPLYNKKD